MKTRRKQRINQTLKNDNNFKMITATVSVENLENNLRFLRKKSKIDVMPVLKANAYGHGANEIARLCRGWGVRYIGVATVGEALQLRKGGDRGKILAWLYDVDQVPSAVSNDVDVAIFDENHIDLISKSLPKSAKANIHLFVDTGINRNGVPYDKAVAAALKISENPKMNLVGLMTHLCCVETSNASTEKQYALFRKLRNELLDLNIKPGLVHISNSGGTLKYDNSDFDMVRSGKALFGMIPHKHLKAVLSLSSKIVQLKDIEKGQRVGYEGKYEANSKQRIAIVPAGFADGVPLNKSGDLTVVVNGEHRKVLGLVSMDQIVVEAKKEDRLGDKVLLFDATHPLYKFAQEGETTTFNISTHLGDRVRFVYR